MRSAGCLPLRRRETPTPPPMAGEEIKDYSLAVLSHSACPSSPSTPMDSRKRQTIM